MLNQSYFFALLIRFGLDDITNKRILSVQLLLSEVITLYNMKISVVM